MNYKAMKLAVLALLVLLITGAVMAKAPERPENIIVMIADGMGIAHITAAELERKDLQLRRFKKIGLQTTTSASTLVTDSAAAGTTLATGFKTASGMIGMSPDKKPLKNVFEYARDNKMARGVVVTSSMNHATPAGFTVHAESRQHYDSLAEQMVEAELDVIFGGGMSSLLPKSMNGSTRRDNKNLLTDLRMQMPVVQSIENFRRLESTRKAAAILANVHLPPATDRNYTLGELTRKALDILDRNENGFILLVEGSQIDLAAHKNLYYPVIEEIMDFDTAVKEAFDFAEKDGNTLLVVTADHETGGLILTGGNLEENKFEYKFSTDYHTATMVPVYSYGPGSDNFMGTYDNTHIGRSLIKLLKK